MTELDCKDIKALLSGLVDGELDATTQHQSERHLAGCKPCRDLVNEAESLNALISMDARRLAAPAGLPVGFENAVLRQTVFAEAYQFAGRKWTSWMGWMAAAACLGLAVSMWFVNPRTLSPQPIARNTVTPDSSAALRAANYSTSGRSWTYDGGLSPDALRFVTNGDSATVVPAAFDQPQREHISREDSDTLYAASNLLAMLQHADHESFADVDRIRQIAEYDELLDRLAESRDRLTASDRAAVMAAEGVLLRVVNGPVSLDDLRALSGTVASMNLPAQVESISARWSPASSL
jgi:hypothetical protein